MRKFPVVCGMAVALMASALCFAADATFVRGSIDKIDGKTLTVGEKSVTVSDATVVVLDKKEVKIDSLAVGQSISARIEGGTAVRIEVHPKAQ